MEKVDRKSGWKKWMEKVKGKNGGKSGLKKQMEKCKKKARGSR